MELLQAIRNRHRASNCDNGITFGVRSGQPGDQIGAAGPGSDQRHSGFPRHATNTAGYKRRVLFMPANDSLDLGVKQRVENFVDLRAGDAEDVFDTLLFETFYQ